MNLVVVVSDTLRRDHLPVYGNDMILAPNLSAFAEQALVFEDAYPASFPTVPTRSDLMTGRYTFTYLDWGPLPQSEITMPQLLSRAGYLTTGIADTPFFLRNGYGHDRGFKDFIWIRGQRSGPEFRDVVATRRSETDYFAPKTFKTAIEWLERHHDEQFLLYVDTWDPHEPWDPPPYYVLPYDPAYQGERIDPVYWDYRKDGVSERELEIAHACYCGEISMVDRWFGIFIDRLRSLGLLEDTAVLFFSDHGFYFGEFGLFGKRRFRWPDKLAFEEGFEHYTLDEGFTFRSPLHNELIRVPLIAHIPGIPAGRRSGLVSLPDIAPTLLDLAGVEVPERMQARSILPLARGEVDRLHDFVVTSAPLETIGDLSLTVDDRARRIKELSPSTIVSDDWDLLYAAEGEPVELYDRKADPGHQTDLASEKSGLVKEMHAAFAAWLEQIGTPEDRLAPRRKL